MALFYPLRNAWRDLCNGLRNLRRWAPVIWWDADFDWDFLAEIMERKLRWMAEDTRNWHVCGAELDRKRMLLCAELLRRLRDDEYWRNAVKRYGETSLAADAARRQQREDQRYLGVVLGKYLNHWWD